MRGGALLVVAELPPDIFSWAEALRQAHYPQDSAVAKHQRMRAHVTLFHGLPPSAEYPVLSVLADIARRPQPVARISGLMDLGDGTALAIHSPALVSLHAEMSERLHGLVQQKDTHALRPHVTIQAKAPPPAVRALRAHLAEALMTRPFHFRGLSVYRLTGRILNEERAFRFRG